MTSCKPLCVVLIAVATFGCRAGASAEQLIAKESTFAESNAASTLYWNVEADGETRLVVKDGAGSVVKKDVTGQLVFKPEARPSGETQPVVLDEKTGVARADGPDLDAEITELRYELVVGGTPVSGALHLPKKGTAGLTANATASGDEKGPHGGAVEVVDGQKYEIVADSESGEARVFLVGAEARRPKKLKLAVQSGEPRVVVLEWHADGYYVAKIDKPPRKATLVVVDDDDDVHVRIVGHRPGVVLVVTERPVFWVQRGWAHPGLARGHHKGTLEGPPGQLEKKGHGGPAVVKVGLDNKGKPAKGKGKSH